MIEQKNEVKEFTIDQIPEEQDIHDIVFNLMADPNLAPINYFNDFTEESIDLSTISNGDDDETGMFSSGNGQMMAISTHALHHHLEIDPQKATEMLVARAVRKMICSGAVPEALSSFLYHINIADPNGQFIAAGAKKGLENACEKFKIKLTDRKIRFDYFSGHGPVLPTIIISLIASIPDQDKLLTHVFKKKGNNIFMIGKSYDDINTSEYLEFYHEISESPLPAFDIEVENQLHVVMKSLIQSGLLSSANPVGKGGLFFSLLRAGMPSGLGFDITGDAEVRADSFLFGEAMGRIVVAVDPKNVDEFVDLMSSLKASFFALGHVTKGEIRVDDESFGFIDKMTPAN
ncbi:MAG TPA: AIR synthase-related protein [Prolixibacteraceae bacterium]|nr:AIR synthase-related protein [Prolixibacteraceae bacterium]